MADEVKPTEAPAPAPAPKKGKEAVAEVVVNPTFPKAGVTGGKVLTAAAVVDLPNGIKVENN